MQAMVKGASSVEEQLASMARAVENLSKTIEEKLRASKDHENKLEGLSQQSVFEKIGGRDIIAYGKGLKRLREEVEDSNAILSIVPSRMMLKTHWEIQIEGMLKIKRFTIVHTKPIPQAILHNDDK
ncbi:hypothetical protein ACH5RR_040751 [Cinchona calisaya]|uniref:Uncharacterized protein n=1 Tax=Cinchona calisaya TaxID=153742 RepID=A0ABD2XXP2_9GENT